ncbi:thioredoxin family protein [Methanosarcina hadiensis]|uniref:thioredoxin family protein n=1 Tax=Methanosarcina hadiensis TaxID=3078083 RepID=UPI00397761F0
MKKPLSILAIFVLIFLSLGCTGTDSSGNETESVETTAEVNNSASEAELVEVTDPSQIDEALTKGPVVLKLGSKGCIPCKEQEDILSEMLPMYKGSASIMLIDIKEYPEFATTFGVRVIPDTCVIADIEDGKYMYMRQDGTESSERANARFLGVADKETLSETLDKAIESRNIEE